MAHRKTEARCIANIRLDVHNRKSGALCSKDFNIANHPSNHVLLFTLERVGSYWQLFSENTELDNKYQILCDKHGAELSDA